MSDYILNYALDFSCTAGKCKHTCCEGWDIAIDGKTLRKYKKFKRFSDERYKNSIDYKNGSFVLNENRRCPFLNDGNLCDVILTFGKENLCQVCSDHPRFRTFFKRRTETGLGLCCEEAGRLVFNLEDKMRLVSVRYKKERLSAWEKTVVGFRSEILGVIQDRSQPVMQRVCSVSEKIGFSFGKKPVSFWQDFLSGTERLNDNFFDVIKRLSLPKTDYTGFERQYEQLLSYFIFRHLGNAFDMRDLFARTAFALSGFFIIKSSVDSLFFEKGSVSISDLIEFSRLFSSETEYSDINFNAFLDVLEELVVL